MKKISLVSGLLCTALMIGCGDDKPSGTGATNPTTNNPTSDSTAGGSETSAGTDDPTSTTNASNSSVPGSTGDGGTSDGTSGGTGSFITPPDGGTGGTKECDPWTQDCAAGEKCMPYSGDGDSSWESLKCVPIDPNPGKTGDKCTTEGGGVSGIDSCDIGHMCWNLDPDTGEGTCVKFCSGSPDAATCDVAGTACTIANDGVLILCLPSCDPLIQDCQGGDLCIPNMDKWICVLDASGEEGQEWDACEYANACDPGFVCMGPTISTNCDPMAMGCCAAFCDINEMTCTDAAEECLPWYEMGMAPPGYESVGVCGTPQ